LENVAARYRIYEDHLQGEYFYAGMFFHHYFLFDLSLQYYRKVRDGFLRTIRELEATPIDKRRFEYYDYENLAQTYANLSGIYAEVGQPDSGHYCLKEALRYRIKNNDTGKMIDSYLMLSRSAIEIKQPHEAINNIQKAEQLIKNSKSNDEKIYDFTITLYKAMAFEQLSRSDSLKHYYFLIKKKWQENTQTAVNPKDFHRLKNKIRQLSFMVRNALRFRDYDLVIGWNDSLNKYQEYYARLGKDIKARESLVKFDVAGKEKLIAALNREKALEKERDAQQQRFIWALSIGLAATLGLGFIIYRQSRHRKKANRILSSQKNQIQLQKAELENAYEELNIILEQIQQQKEEITQQRDELAAQADQIVQQRDQLEKAYHHLQELDRFKEAMSGMIVHDLKNPLSTIINLSEKSNLSDKDQLTIRQAGKQMLNLTLNILDVQKYEQTEVPLNLQDHPLASVVLDAFDQVSLLALNKNISLTTDFAPSIGIFADFELIARVLMNLLTNAIKYTPNNGNIVISAENQTDSYVRIAVKDNGKGIPADKLHTVFDKFSQVEAKKSGGARSTGLGLTFCKLTVEAHGGTIGVESTVGEGTIFYFCLPKSLSHVEAELPTIIQNTADTGEIVLSAEEQAILRPYLEQLQRLDVYDAGEILKVISSLPDKDNLSRWKSEMEHTIFASNQERYTELIFR
jgi:signal transduction histidine kinase